MSGDYCLNMRGDVNVFMVDDPTL